MRGAGPASVLLAAVLSAGCGYQLRGQAELPAAMARTYIDAPRTSDALPRQLGLLLSGSGIEVVDSPGAASAVLRIGTDRIDRLVQAVGATARVREFALRYTVDFEVVAADGSPLVAAQQLELRDDYQFDQEQVLGTTSEEELLRREMVRTMAGHIVRRIELLAR